MLSANHISFLFRLELIPLENWSSKSNQLLHNCLLHNLQTISKASTNLQSASVVNYTFAGQMLKYFPSLVEENKDLWCFLTELISHLEPNLSQVSSQLLSQHVQLCLQLLNLVPEKERFYSTLTSLKCSEWLLAFCEGLIHQEESLQNKECISVLISSDNFLAKIQDILCKNEELTKQESTLLLTSIKYGKQCTIIFSF